MMSQTGSITIVNFMTPGVGILVWGCGRVGHRDSSLFKILTNIDDTASSVQVCNINRIVYRYNLPPVTWDVIKKVRKIMAYLINIVEFN